MSILLFVNLKGGVAKTTNAVAVSECLADTGYRVLLIDADHQCTSGELLLGESRFLNCERRRVTLHDMLAAMLDDEFKPEQLPSYVVKNGSDIGGGLPKLSLIPCSIRIDDFSTNMAKAKKGYHSTEEFNKIFQRRREMLRKWLKADYDFTIVDCPPSLTMQVRVFLTVADAFVLPTIPDRLSVRGSLTIMDRIGPMGYKISGLGTLWTLYREQNKVHRKMIEATSKRVEPLHKLPRPFEAIIPNAAAIAEATEPDRKPKSFNAKYTTEFANKYRSLCEEIVQRCQWQMIPSREQAKVTATNGMPGRNGTPLASGVEH